MILLVSALKTYGMLVIFASISAIFEGLCPHPRQFVLEKASDAGFFQHKYNPSPCMRG
ncbi:hypothetical protein [Candidatus Chloroploca mongolica]|uniref:hypothetical protein n=1 Tax=Candidatus Chloroploca mongolica TaxID=2528176 RepID=UPI001AE671C9|nr:hypothetical protein [Candidatus Chloroploca mongolica]